MLFALPRLLDAGPSTGHTQVFACKHYALIDNDLRCELDRLLDQSDGNSHENILNQFDIDSHYYETADMNLADSDGNSDPYKYHTLT